jgi:hypothetical protein
LNSSRARHIPALLVIHTEELAFLWGQRRVALNDTRYVLKSFLALTQRVEAHIQGLLAVPGAIPALLAPKLIQAQDRDDAFAAAVALLRLADPALTLRIVQIFAAAQGAQLVGLRDAFSFAAIGPSAATVQHILNTGDPTHAVNAAVVLANHGLLDARDPRLAALAADADAAVAELAWRALASADAKLAASRAPLPPRPYKESLSRPEPTVRSAAIAAALWGAQPWVVPGLRKLAAQGDAVGVAWLAAVGSEPDWPQIQAGAALLPNPVDRPALLGRFGHPASLAVLEGWMRSPDIVLGAAAGDAFTRITGADVSGPRATVPVADDADDFTREFAPQVFRPDLASVAAHIAKHGAGLNQGTRWNRGLSLTLPAGTALPTAIDLPARWDAVVRSAAAGQAVAAPPPIV